MKAIRALCTAASLWGALAAAEPRVAVVGAGACRDAELVSAVRGLSAPLAKERSVRLVAEDVLFARLGRGPARSPEELEQGVVEARQLFGAGRHGEALGRLEVLQAEIARLSPGPRRWNLWASAVVAEGVVRTQVKGSTRPEDAFFRVLRLAPSHVLDRDDYGPSVLARFERVRLEVQKSKRAPLKVRSTRPGADVFLDGRRVGATPYSGEHVPGRYQLVLVHGDAVSLPRTIDVGPSTVQVDLRFEGTVETSSVPCLADGEGAVRLGSAVRLGTLLEVDSLVVLRVERADAGAGWLSATVVDIVEGRKVREGGLGIGATGAGEAELRKLARFVTTGESAVDAPVPAQEDPAPVEGLEAKPAAPAEAGSPFWRRRSTGQVATAAGAATLIAGGVLTGLGVSAEGDYRRLTRGGLEPDDAPAARRAADRSAVLLPLGIGSMAVGALASAAGAWIWSNAADSEGGVTVTAVTVWPGLRHGTTAFANVGVSGRF